MEAEKKSRNLIFVTTTGILVVLLGVLGWQFIEQKDAAEKAQLERGDKMYCGTASPLARLLYYIAT